MFKVIMVAVAACFMTTAGFAGSCCAAKKAASAKVDCAPATAPVAKPAVKDAPSTSTVVAKK